MQRFYKIILSWVEYKFDFGTFLIVFSTFMKLHFDLNERLLDFLFILKVYKCKVY